MGVRLGGGQAWRMFTTEWTANVKALRWGKAEWVRGSKVRPGWLEASDLPGPKFNNSLLSWSAKLCRKDIPRLEIPKSNRKKKRIFFFLILTALFRIVHVLWNEFDQMHYFLSFFFFQVLLMTECTVFASSSPFWQFYLFRIICNIFTCKESWELKCSSFKQL